MLIFTMKKSFKRSKDFQSEGDMVCVQVCSSQRENSSRYITNNKYAFLKTYKYIFSKQYKYVFSTYKLFERNLLTFLGPPY